MRRLPFIKMSGAGNDFILLQKDWLGGAKVPAARLAKQLCPRHRSIGADGLLVVSRSGRLSYHNADGSAAFCANGSRCAAWWLLQTGRTRPALDLRTSQGTIRASIPRAATARTFPPFSWRGKTLDSAGIVRIQMPTVRKFQLNLRLRAGGRIWTAHFFDTGSPHLVMEVRDIARVPVVPLGRLLRGHRSLGRGGANVNFLQKIQEEPRRSEGSVLFLRTYERGVEDETLACGTGAVAAALCAHLLRASPSPVSVRTRDGDILKVGFQHHRDRFDSIYLDGPVAITYAGEVSL